MRNNLFHGQSTKVSEIVDIPKEESQPEEDQPNGIDEKTTAKLEDIVERYLCKGDIRRPDYLLEFWRERKAANASATQKLKL